MLEEEGRWVECETTDHIVLVVRNWRPRHSGAQGSSHGIFLSTARMLLTALFI